MSLPLAVLGIDPGLGVSACATVGVVGGTPRLLAYGEILTPDAPHADPVTLVGNARLALAQGMQGARDAGLRLGAVAVESVRGVIARERRPDVVLRACAQSGRLAATFAAVTHLAVLEVPAVGTASAPGWREMLGARAMNDHGLRLLLEGTFRQKFPHADKGRDASHVVDAAGVAYAVLMRLHDRADPFQVPPAEVRAAFYRLSPLEAARHDALAEGQRAARKARKVAARAR